MGDCHMKSRKIRIGIDVGGTFTKGVAIDENFEIIGKEAVLTTHTAREGVAKGVIQVFMKLLKNHDINPEEVVFVAHSTTQATNCLLEGDVEPVGIVGMGTGIDGLRAKSQTKVGDIKLAQDRILRTYHSFIDTSKINDEIIRRTVRDLLSKGAKVIVASEAFGVDDPKNELRVIKIANELGVPATGGHMVSKLYGLKIRTRTAVINSSILPKMIETANMTEQSMRKVGIKAPLMIMRGDGGVMSIDEMRKRPILTILSGPAASVAGALMYLRVSDGIFFEVGGTSTNIGVIRYGQPTLKYVEVGGYKTFINSLDVRVLGIAGGSMVRVRGNKIIDVGPRSAHIAGFPYSAFAKTEDIKNPKVIFVQPRPGDPNDYIAIKTENGKIYAITTTCAANAIGITKPGDYAHGNPEAARRAIEPLAKKLGKTVDEIAEEILKIASTKIIRLINQLIDEYELDPRNVLLVGGGGGAAALIPYVSKVTGIDYVISENAEVISSIGVALAMVKEVVERTITNPTPEDLLHIRKEAEMMAIKSGAAPNTVEVHVEVDTERQRVRAIAMGSTELRTKQLSKECTLEEKIQIAAKSMNTTPEMIKHIATTGDLDVFVADVEEKGTLKIFKRKKKLMRVIDKNGVIKLSLTSPIVMQSTVEKVLNKDLDGFLTKNQKCTDGGTLIPRTFILLGKRIIDLSGLINRDQVISIAKVELQGLNPEDPVILIGTHAR